VQRQERARQKNPQEVLSAKAEKLLAAAQEHQRRHGRRRDTRSVEGDHQGWRVGEAGEYGTCGYPDDAQGKNYGGRQASR